MSGWLLWSLVMLAAFGWVLFTAIWYHYWREEKNVLSYNEYWHSRRAHDRADDLQSEVPTKPLAAGEVE